MHHRGPARHLGLVSLSRRVETALLDIVDVKVERFGKRVLQARGAHEGLGHGLGEGNDGCHEMRVRLRLLLLQKGKILQLLTNRRHLGGTNGRFGPERSRGAAMPIGARAIEPTWS